MKTTRSRRNGFTTIELLVVIAVIAILVALTTGAVSRVRLAAKRAETVSEAGQLATAVQNFMREKKVDYIPSRIRLRKGMNYMPPADTLDRDSYTYLKQVWPQIQLNTNIIWTTFPGAANDTVLEGDQCLVFFLGGIPLWDSTTSRYAASGFSKNPADPSGGGNPAQLGGAYFQFKASRLKDYRGNSGFPSYFDPYFTGDPGDRPFAYFSAYGRKNGYVLGDCATIAGAAFVPYQDTANSYYQPTGFQIISAGPDQNFGVGGLAPSANTALGRPDADNITHFANGQISNIGN